MIIRPLLNACGDSTFYDSLICKKYNNNKKKHLSSTASPTRLDWSDVACRQRHYLISSHCDESKPPYLSQRTVYLNNILTDEDSN